MKHKPTAPEAAFASYTAEERRAYARRLLAEALSFAEARPVHSSIQRRIEQAAALLSIE